MKQNAKDAHNRLMRINQLSSQTRIISNQDISVGPKHIPVAKHKTFVKKENSSPFTKLEQQKTPQPKVSVSALKETNEARIP